MPMPTRTGLAPSDYFVDANGCWIWQKWTDRDGYGSLSAGGKRWSAHRFSWTLVNGPIPDDMHVDHTCFVPACINPAHLRLLSPIENMWRHRATFKTQCSRGHDYTPENTRIERRSNGRTFRRCAACAITYARERSRARRALAKAAS